MAIGSAKVDFPCFNQGTNLSVYLIYFSTGTQRSSELTRAPNILEK